MQGLISIIMPAYNVAQYIRETIASVQAQTYTQWELIVVDDGSFDETASMVQALQADDARIRLIQQENAGVSVARNAGIEAAQGAYISFLDADDLWLPDCLAKLVAAMTDGRQFVYARTEEFWPDGRTALIGPTESTEGRLHAFIAKNEELRLTFHISAMLIDKVLISKYNLRFPQGIKISEDTAFFIALLCVTDAYAVPEVLSRYRRREVSATTLAWRPESWIGLVTIYDLLEPFVKQYAPQELPYFYRMRNFVAYRFCLRCIRHRYMDVALQYLQAWQPRLLAFSRSGGKAKDRWKCRALLWAVPHKHWLAFVGKL